MAPGGSGEARWRVADGGLKGGARRDPGDDPHRPSQGRCRARDQTRVAATRPRRRARPITKRAPLVAS